MRRTRVDIDSIHEECGIVGVYGNNEAARFAYLGLISQQHRGQESSGIVSTDGVKVYAKHGSGLVTDYYNEHMLNELRGHIAVGHNRYSTCGRQDGTELDTQPFIEQTTTGTIALAHNGNIIFEYDKRAKLEAKGYSFKHTSDSEIFLKLIIDSKFTKLSDRVSDASETAEAAFSIIVTHANEMTAVRDIYGYRPLCLGELKSGGFVIASESCAFSLMDATFIREITPGEIVDFSSGKPTYSFLKRARTLQRCIFELIYFAHPNSEIFGENVYEVRKKFGAQLVQQEVLAHGYAIKDIADIVIPVPDSGVSAALGYAQTAGLPYEMGLIRNHYRGRTFIEPVRAIRNFGVRAKLSPNGNILKGARVVVVDDSIVRGTTSQKIIQMLLNAGATQVHMRVSSPPIIDVCYYGVDIKCKTELVAHNRSIEDIRKFIGANSLEYLSHESMLNATNSTKTDFCGSCFTGDHPLMRQSIHSQTQPMMKVIY